MTVQDTGKYVLLPQGSNFYKRSISYCEEKSQSTICCLSEGIVGRAVLTLGCGGLGSYHLV